MPWSAIDCLCTRFPIIGIDVIIGKQYLLLSVVAGIFTLASTWLTNTMTVKKMIPEINQILTISGIISIVLIALVFVWGYSAVF